MLHVCPFIALTVNEVEVLAATYKAQSPSGVRKTCYVSLRLTVCATMGSIATVA